MAILIIENGIYFFVLLLVWLVSVIFLRYSVKRGSKAIISNYPPTPPAIPLIGHLHLVTPSLLHTSFDSIASRYGPLVQLHLGATNVLIVSDSCFAKEILKTHELNFLSRPQFGLAEYSRYRDSGYFSAPYGEYWKLIKKLSMTKVLSVSTLNQFTNLRQDEVMKLVELIKDTSSKGIHCQLNELLLSFTNNIICRMTMSTRCSGNKDEAKNVKTMLDNILYLGQKLSMGDVLGCLSKYVLFGYGIMLHRVLEEYDQFVEKIMQKKEKKMEMHDDSKTNDLLDILLQCCDQDPDDDDHHQIKLTRTNAKSLLLEMLLGGTETLASSIQWAIAELINHPQVLRKLREEIGSVVGSNPTRLMNESDIPNLSYLQAIVKETLRLHPPAPFTIRECQDDIKINGFDLKSKSRMIINLYTIMRDEKLWSNATEFVPERFITNDIVNPNKQRAEMKANINFDYFPFGSGRRSCPGSSLALVVIQLAVGVLVQCFDWKLKDNTSSVDMTESLNGLTLVMKNPLVCYPTVRFSPIVK